MASPTRPPGLTARELLRATREMKQGGESLKHWAIEPRTHSASLCLRQPCARLTELCLPPQSRRPACSLRSSSGPPRGVRPAHPRRRPRAARHLPRHLPRHLRRHQMRAQRRPLSGSQPACRWRRHGTAQPPNKSRPRSSSRRVIAGRKPAEGRPLRGWS